MITYKHMFFLNSGQMLSYGDGTIIEGIFLVGFFTYLSSNLFICCYVAEQLRSEVSIFSVQIAIIYQYLNNTIVTFV